MSTVTNVNKNSSSQEKATTGFDYQFHPKDPDHFWSHWGEGRSWDFFLKFLHANQIMNHFVHPYSDTPFTLCDSWHALIDLSILTEQLKSLSISVSNSVLEQMPDLDSDYEVDSYALIYEALRVGIEHLNDNLEDSPHFQDIVDSFKKAEELKG